ncbi:MAG: GGDEF domain-containing protein [Acidimicrobiia bacterium]|nr:GGDEF domain-containing protein [Acidimicrobiia bacterium]
MATTDRRRVDGKRPIATLATLLLAASVVVTVSTASVNAQEREIDTLEEARLLAIVVVAERAAYLEALDLLATPVPAALDAVIDEVAVPRRTTTEELLDVLEEIEVYGQVAGFELTDHGIDLSDPVRETLGPVDLSPADPGIHLDALADLVERAGGAPAGSGRSIDVDLLLAEVVLAFDVVYDDTGTRSESDDGVSWLVVGVAVGVALGGLAVAVVALAVTRGRRPVDDADPGNLDELLDLSRRLATAPDPESVERLAVREAVALTGARAAAVVRRDGDMLHLGVESEPGLLVAEHMIGSIFARVAETGQPLRAVVRDDAAIRHLPVSVVAVPVVRSGQISALLAVFRAAEVPFDPGEQATLGSMAPLVAAAVDGAQRVGDATAASLSDPLTGVGNRRRLDADLGALLDRSSTDGENAPSVAVVMMDLDRFKDVNDNHGHPAGDRLLREVADILRAEVRPGDSVYRYGGEEFCLVLPETTLADAAAVAERIRMAVGQHPLPINATDRLAVTASFGVAATDPTVEHAREEVVAQADAALYRAKSAGRDRVVTMADPTS